MTDSTQSGRQYEPGTHPDLPPPPGTVGAIGWVRQNLFSSIGNSILTILSILLVLWIVPAVVKWAAIDATTYGESRYFCNMARQTALMGERAASVDYAALRNGSGVTQKNSLRNFMDASRQAGSFAKDYKPELVSPEFAALVDQTGFVALSGEIAEQTKDLGAAVKKSKVLEPGGPSEVPPEVATALAAVNLDALQSGFQSLQPLVSYADSHDGACWTLIKERWYQYIFGFYPRDQVWRVVITAILFGLALAPILFDNVPHRRAGLIYACIFPVIAFFLLMGGIGLQDVGTEKLGGLLLTMIISVTGIAGSLPIGIVLALGRRSNMPAIRLLCVVFIEFIRGVPLITILFMGSNMLPLFLPEGVNFDKLLRALIAVTLFSSAYMAEVVRGGLQAIPKGQYEGAMALGLGFWRMMGLIVLPQALRIVIPGIVSNFIGLFKDTSLVSIIGLFDLLQIAKAAVTDTKWLALATETYVFIAVIYFVICFGMARYSIWLEDKLYTGHKR